MKGSSFTPHFSLISHNPTSVTDINLLRDRGFGDESSEELEKQKRKARVVVELTNPGKEPQHEITEKPGGGFWSFLKNLFSRKKSTATGVPGKARILHEERIQQPEKKSPPQQKKVIKERYETAQQHPSAAVEDIFAPSAAVVPDEAPPKGQEAAHELPPQLSATLSGGSFRGAVNTPPARPETPGMNAPTPQPDQRPSAARPSVKEKQRPESTDAFLGVNLVPEEMMSGGAQQNRLVTLGLLALISILIVGLVYVGLSIFQSRIVNETQANGQSISALEQQIQKLNAKKRSAAAFHALTTSTLKLLDTHVYWTKFFGGLEKYTVQNVQIRSFTADQAGHLTLSLSAKDYRAVAQQLIAFEAAKDFASNVTINAATLSESDKGASIDFTAIITLDPKVFYRDSTGGPLFSIE